MFLFTMFSGLVCVPLVLVEGGRFGRVDRGGGLVRLAGRPVKRHYPVVRVLNK